jgi:hypothetical protein
MLASGMHNLNEKYYLTPIGPVPVTFDFLSDLIRVAHIGYRDELITSTDEEGKPKTEAVRTWHIVRDSKMIPSTRTTAMGKRIKDDKRMVTACNEHLKFCMIVDYITHMLRKGGLVMDWPAILRIAIGKQAFYETALGGQIEFAEQVEKMRGMDWRSVRNTLAKHGVPNYTAVGEPETLTDF